MPKHPFIHLCGAAALLLTLSACAPSGSMDGGTIPNPSSDGSSASDAAAGNAGEQKGVMSQFTTTDLDGNEVDQSIFADYKLTMINVWGTFCPPCIHEMPDLGEIAEEYADKDVRIVGLVADSLNPDGTISEGQVETAKEIVEKTGANYLHILPSPELYHVLSAATALPTTFFVDSEGNQVGHAVVSAQSKDKWIETIDSMLAEVEA